MGKEVSLRNGPDKGRESSRVVKDDAQRVALAAMKRADAMAQIGAVESTGTAKRPVVDRKDDSLTLRQLHHFDAGLSSRPLLAQHELAAREVLPRRAQQERQLQGEDEIAVKILVQPVV